MVSELAAPLHPKPQFHKISYIAAATARLMREPNVQELVSVITAIVDPRKRDSLQLNLHHQTPLTGTKSRKQLSHKQKKTKLKTLTRKQNAELGLYTLPTKSLKYAELMPLHTLWTEYMRQHLSLTAETQAPAVDEPGYENFSKLLVKSDLHGAIVRVTRSKCPTLLGATGIVAMETKNTFKIVSEDNRTRSEL